MKFETFIAKSALSESRRIEVAPSNLVGRVKILLVDDWAMRHVREGVAISIPSARAMATALSAAADEAERLEAEAIKQDEAEVVEP